MGRVWNKRRLRPRIPVELGARARADIAAANYRSKNREALALRQKIGCPIGHARALLAFDAAAGSAPVAVDRQMEG